MAGTVKLKLVVMGIGLSATPLYNLKKMKKNFRYIFFMITVLFINQYYFQSIPLNIADNFNSLNPNEGNQKFIPDKLQYENESQIDSIISKSEDGTENKHIYVYDLNDKLIYDIKKNESNQNISRMTYTYDTNDNVELSISENWNGSTWQLIRRIMQTYDSNMKFKSNTYQYWNGNIWINQQKDNLYYDSNSNITLRLLQIYFDNGWHDIHRYIYNYNSDNLMIFSMYEKWDDLGDSLWASISRAYYTYDINKNKSSLISEEWDNYQWEFYSQLNWTYTYDESQNISSTIEQKWINNEWKNISRTIYTYNLFNNVDTILLESWTNEKWVNNLFDSYIYNANGELISATFKKWNETEYFGRNNNLSIGLYQISNATEINIYYKPITDITEEDNIKHNYSLSQNYPNPFNPNTIIRYSIPINGKVRICLFDLLGNEIEVLVDGYQQIGEYELELNAGDLANGVYFYRIISNDYSETKKMLLLK